MATDPGVPFEPGADQPLMYEPLPGEELTPAELAALAALDDGPLDPAEDDDSYGDGFGPDNCPPEGWELMTAAERWAFLESEPSVAGPLLPEPAKTTARPPPAGPATGPGGPVTPVPEVLEAGFTHRDGGAASLGFAAGGALDRMEPGELLALFADRAWQDGLSRLSDNELCGLLAAQRRLASRAAAGELAAITELAARRAGPGGRPGEHLEEEVAALLTLTGRAAGRQVALAESLSRLPGVSRALAAGRIDLPKATVFAGQLALVEYVAANAIAAITLPDAPGMTTGQLRSALQREVLAYDPEAGIRRRQEAEKEARVETWTEAAGTGAIAGRDLPPADVLAADKTLDADARWLKARGVEGTMDQLRAKAFTARLTGQSLQTLLCPSPGTGAGASPSLGPGASASPPPNPGPNPPPRPSPGPPAPGLGQPSAPASGWPGALSRVNLVMPAAAWLGRSDAPGEIGGLGVADAGTCRDLANALARQPAAQWCVTLTDRHGRAVAHGCARGGPGPPGTGDRTGWLATVTVTPVETGTCEHRRESAGYQPSDSLRHIIKIRSPRCGFPGCRRPAVRCDDDHSIPFHQGGRTCECNLYPLCRRHHQTKQARGWQLSQPEPGTLIWTAPSWRRYTVHAEPYPG
jgi:hypothetical protein